MDKRHALADGFSGDEIEVLVARNKRGRTGRCVFPDALIVDLTEHGTHSSGQAVNATSSAAPNSPGAATG
jgi:hypothetical protein